MNSKVIDRLQFYKNSLLKSVDKNEHDYIYIHEYNANNPDFTDYFSQYNNNEIETGSYRKIAAYLHHNLMRVEIVPDLLEKLKVAKHDFDFITLSQQNGSLPFTPKEVITIKRNLKYEMNVYRKAIKHLQHLISLTNKEISRLAEQFKPLPKGGGDIGVSLLKSFTGLTAIENIVQGAETNDDRRFLRGLASLTLKLTGVGLLMDAFDGAEAINDGLDATDLLTAGLSGYLLYDVIRDVKPMVDKYITENFSQKQKNGSAFLYTFDYRDFAKEEIAVLA